MLAEFQQALCDLTASPRLCIEARKNPAMLRERYKLTDREALRLVGIVRHRGMESACIVYRANRLAPLAMNVPATCKALGPSLRPLLEEFWELNPETNVHFFVETHRFCRFLQTKLETGYPFSEDAIKAIKRESKAIADALTESLTESSMAP
jgi:hypothetical protein